MSDFFEDDKCLIDESYIKEQFYHYDHQCYQNCECHIDKSNDKPISQEREVNIVVQPVISNKKNRQINEKIETDDLFKFMMRKLAKMNKKIMTINRK
jgi:hypothetical protein